MQCMKAIGLVVQKLWPKFKVRKVAKIRNQYNQVPHLIQDTTWESDKNTITHHKQEPKGHPFPSRLPQGSNEQMVSWRQPHP